MSSYMSFDAYDSPEWHRGFLRPEDYLPSHTTVVVTGLWGWDRKTGQPGEMFDICFITGGNTQTVRSLYGRIEAQYIDNCARRGCDPRDAYVLERVTGVGAGAVDFFFGT